MFALGLLLGFLCVTPIVTFYVVVVRTCDRFEREPWWVIACSLMWGAIFATVLGGVVAGFAEVLVARAVVATGFAPWELGTEGGIDALGATVFAPLFEEGAKGLGLGLIAALTLLKMRELNGPLDGAIYGGVIGLGFTLTEDVLYVAKQFAESGAGGFAGLLFLRTVLLGLSHCTFTACTGLGFGIAAESRSGAIKVLAPSGGFLCAVAMHSVHNALPTFFGDGGLRGMLLVTWGIAVAYFLVLALLVRRSRKHIIEELHDEVGRTVGAREAQLVASYFTLTRLHIRAFFAEGPSIVRDRRRKQHTLLALAFLKRRRRLGEHSLDEGVRESVLRAILADANRAGVIIG